MARDRKRAKHRRARRGTAPAQGPSGDQSAGHSEVGGASLRGGQDAALIRGGAPGHTAGTAGSEDVVAATPASSADTEADTDTEAGAELDPGEDALQIGGVPPGGGRPPGGDDGGPSGDAAQERPSGAPLRGGNRAIGFLRASWAELQRVQWPDRRQVSQATAVVLGFVAIAGAYLGAADYVAKEIVEFVL